jgi:hypothetical protein
MRAILTLLFLFVSWSSFADDVRIDPAYFNDGVYDAEIDAAAANGAFYDESVDGPAVIQVMEVGRVACTRYTKIGMPCLCNSGILNRNAYPGWTMFAPFLYVRPGWHLTKNRGMHAGGNVCYKDREATPEERAQFHRTGH